MKLKSLLFIAVFSIFNSIDARRCCGGGGGFWDVAGGTFVGSTFGTALGNYISRPCRQDVVVVNQRQLPPEPAYQDDSAYIERREVENERRKTELEIIREKNRQKDLELEERRLRIEERKVVKQKK